MTPRVLLADDSLTIQKVITLTLDRFDLDLSFCKSQPELEEKLQNEEFDILLLDYNISENISGTDFIKELNQKYPRLRILPLLGTLDDEAIADLHTMGIDQAVSKPFDGKTFVAAFESVLGSALTESNAPQSMQEPFNDHAELPDIIDQKTHVDDSEWEQEVPGVIGQEELDAMADIPSVIGDEAPLEPVRFPKQDDLAYPDSDKTVSSVKDEITSKLVSLDDLDPLGEDGGDDFQAPEMGGESTTRIQDIEEQIHEEVDPDLWKPDVSESKIDMPGMSKSEVRLIAQEVVEDYMKESLKRALKEIVPEIAEKIINKEIQKITDRILKDDF